MRTLTDQNPNLNRKADTTKKVKVRSPKLNSVGGSAPPLTLLPPAQASSIRAPVTFEKVTVTFFVTFFSCRFLRKNPKNNRMLLCNLFSKVCPSRPSVNHPGLGACATDSATNLQQPARTCTNLHLFASSCTNLRRKNFLRFHSLRELRASVVIFSDEPNLNTLQPPTLGNSRLPTLIVVNCRHSRNRSALSTLSLNTPSRSALFCPNQRCSAIFSTPIPHRANREVT